MIEKVPHAITLLKEIQTLSSKYDVNQTREILELIETKIKFFTDEEKELFSLNDHFADLHYYIVRLTNDIKEKKDSKAIYGLSKNTQMLVKEFKEGVRESIAKDHKVFLTLLAKYTRKRFESDFKAFYKDDPKGFVDKFHRDHRLSGAPFAVLRSLKKLSTKFDYFVIALRGGLPYAIILELLGVKRNRLKFIKAGRGKLVDHLVIESVDDLSQLRNKKVLLIDNNAGSGRTAKLIETELAKYTGDLHIFLEYLCAYGENTNDSILAQLSSFKSITIAQKTNLEIEVGIEELIRKLNMKLYGKLKNT